MNAQEILKKLERNNPGELEFLQAAKEVILTVEDVYNSHPHFDTYGIIERILDPDRVFIFKVPWVDDDGKVQVNRAFRVQFNNTLGPYKGGLRFHPSVNLSILKFLGFEQIFKNALTGLPLGGGKGGSDFDPKGKSNNEVMRFCQSFMNELHRYIGPEIDIPAGDIGVGGREIGYLYGQYRKLTHSFVGTLTGKGLNWGGSWIRKEATGYGLVYIVKNYLEVHRDNFEGKNILLSGAGNVAIYAAEKVMELGGKVLTMSDSNGYIYDKNGIDLDLVKDIKEVNRGRLYEYLDTHGQAEYNETRNDVWKIKADIALPCATENELDIESAKALVANGCKIVAEGANMPTTLDATNYFLDNKVIFIPGKAANAGGVAVSGLEMSQNAMKLQWLPEEVDERLKQIMENIHETCLSYGKEPDGYVNFVKGANIAGFMKVANAMVDQGVI